MKVLQINAVYGHGSTGTIVRDIEQLCYAEGIECLVASPDPAVRQAKHGFVIGNTIDHKLHAALSRIYGKQAYYSRCATRALLKYMDREKPDIVHLHNLHSNYIHLNMLLDYLAKRDIITIVTLHDCWFYTGGCFHYANAECYRWLEKCGNCPKQKLDTPALLKDCSAQILADRKKYLLAIPRLVVTGVSDWIANEARRTFLADTKLVTIRNGIDLNVFKPTPSDFRQRLKLEGKYVILGPASKWLSDVNKEVLDKFTKLMHPDEVLLLFGVDVQDTSNLPKNVITYGYTKNREELAQLYTMADVFVNCTREESLSLINIEAQACGTPVVTFDATATPETVDGIYSKSVECNDIRLMYNAIVEIRKSPKAIHAEFIKTNYNLLDNYKLYITLYQNTYEH